VIGANNSSFENDQPAGKNETNLIYSIYRAGCEKSTQTANNDVLKGMLKSGILVDIVNGKLNFKLFKSLNILGF